MAQVLRMVVRVLVLACTFSAGSLRAAEDDSVSLQLKISDITGRPLACRVHLMNEHGISQKAEGLPFWNDHFVCPGQATVRVVPGRYSWEIERGPEYERASGQLEVTLEKTPAIAVTLKRIAELRAEGWYSGDLHVHRAVKDVELLMRAEDLDFAPVITWWNQRKEQARSPSQTQFAFDGHRIYETLGGEDEREGGALLYFGLRQPLDLKVMSREFPSPMQFVQQAYDEDADVWIDIEKPFWWDVPAWLASGQMKSIGIANNHMCRSRMYENEAWGRPRDETRLPIPRGNGFWTQEIYYHALNSGLRLPPSAGSASGVLPNPVGYNRVYVHPNGPFTRDSWFAALAKGNCFVTNGPLLRVTANRQLPGGVFRLSDQTPQQISITVKLTSRDRVRNLQIIHNGRIAKTIPCTAEVSQQKQIRFAVSEPGWFLIRAIADVEHTFRFACTAPWYVESDTVAQRISRPSAQFFLDWIDERTERVRKNVTDAEQLRAVLEPHENARAFWTDRVARANADTAQADTDEIERTSAQVSELPAVSRVAAQPLLASVRRLVEAMDYVGSPLPESLTAELNRISVADDDARVTQQVQNLLDPLCLAELSVQENGPPVVRPGRARRKLVEQGWRTFLIKVVNTQGHVGRLRIESPSALPIPHAPAEQVASRWMQISTYEGRPLRPNLSGLALEYRIVQVYATDPGRKSAMLDVSVSKRSVKNGGLLREWQFDKGSDGWRVMNRTQTQMTVKDGAMHVTSTGNDPFIGTDIKGPGGKFVLRFWGKTEEKGVGQFFWWTKDIPQATGDRQATFSLQPGREQLYEIPFTVDGKLAGVRIDPLVRPGKMRIDWIDLHSAEGAINRTTLPIEFECVPSAKVTLRVLDTEGNPAFAKFEIRDADGRIYPAQSKRLAPDFFFQPQIYRGDGESISLPEGEYTIECSRGPETITKTKRLIVGQRATVQKTLCGQRIPESRKANRITSQVSGLLTRHRRYRLFRKNYRALLQSGI